MIHKKTFVAGELNGSYQLEYTHNLGTSDIIAFWYDNTGVARITADLFQVVDDNNVILSCNESITGTHTLLMYYDEAGATASGRRLFELTTTDDPATSLRLPLGKASTPASNILLSDFLSWLLDNLGFLKVASNLADLNNVASARAALAIYSAAQVDTYLAQKATLYQAGSGSVLGVANTSIFNPTANYHPATLRNVKNLGIKPLLAAQISSSGSWTLTHFLNSDVLDLGDLQVTRDSTGVYTITHNFGSTAYMVICQTLNETDKQVHVAEIDKNANTFVTHIYDLNSGENAAFEFIMFAFNSYTADE